MQRAARVRRYRAAVVERSARMLEKLPATMMTAPAGIVSVRGSSGLHTGLCQHSSYSYCVNNVMFRDYASCSTGNEVRLKFVEIRSADDMHRIVRRHLVGADHRRYARRTDALGSPILGHQPLIRVDQHDRGMLVHRGTGSRRVSAAVGMNPCCRKLRWEAITVV